MGKKIETTLCLREWDFMFSPSKWGREDGEQKTPEQTRDAEVPLADYLGGEFLLTRRRALFYPTGTLYGTLDVMILI